MKLRRNWGSLRLYVASPRFLLVTLQRTTVYWRLLERFQSISFRLTRGVFSLRGWARRHVEGFGIWRDVLSAVWKNAVFAIGLTILLLVSDRFTLAFGFIDAVEGKWRLNDPSTFLATVAQIAGVFLGLYFTAVSIVISTSYARVSQRIRGLLLRDKVGSRYISIVALLTAVALLLVAASIFGYMPGPISILSVTLLTLLSIYSFVALGLRVFYFFDPTALSGIAFDDARKAMRFAAASKFEHTQLPFQAYYHRQATEALLAVQELITLCNEEKYLHGEPPQLIAAGLFELLREYSGLKRRIPTKSRWFEQVARHPEWLLADYSRVDMALRTGTSLSPEYVPDPLWMERKVADITKDVLHGMHRRGDREGAYKVLGHSQRCIEALGICALVEEGRIVVDSLGAGVWEFVEENPVRTVNEQMELSGITYTLALVDIYGSCFIASSLSLVRSFSSVVPTALARSLDTIDWTNKRSIYAQDFPLGAIPQLEELQRSIDFEIQVEGKVASAPWYIKQLVCLSLTRAAKTALEALGTDLGETFVGRAKELADGDGTQIYAAQHIQRGLEYCSKMMANLRKLKSAVNDLESFRVAQDIPWPSFDWKSAQTSITSHRERLIALLAKCVVPIAKLGKTDKLPDYFGQAYSVLADECYWSLAHQKSELFRSIFDSFFLGALFAYEQLRLRLQGQSPETFIVFSSEPLADLLEISGYAKAYSELNGDNAIWSRVQATWDTYLGASDNPAQLLQQVVSLAAYRESLFGLKPRDLARSTWGGEIQSQLEKGGFARGLLDPGFLDDRRHLKRHASPLIRALARHAFIGLNQGTTIFIATYVRNRAEAASITSWPSDVDRFIQDLNRPTDSDE